MVVEAYCDPPNFEEGAGETGARGEVREKVSDVGATRCGWVLVYFAFGVAVCEAAREGEGAKGVGRGG